MTIDGLDPCISYWVVVAAAVGCVSRVTSTPQLIHAFMINHSKKIVIIKMDIKTRCKVFLLGSVSDSFIIVLLYCVSSLLVFSTIIIPK